MTIIKPNCMKNAMFANEHMEIETLQHGHCSVLTFPALAQMEVQLKN